MLYDVWKKEMFVNVFERKNVFLPNQTNTLKINYYEHLRRKNHDLADGDGL